MFAQILVVLGLIYAPALGRLFDEDLPPEQMRKFLSDVIIQAKGSLVSRRDLPNVDLQLHQVVLGFPLELALVTKNTILTGPSSLSLYGNIEGQQLPSGSATIRTSLAVGNLEVKYQYFLLDIFGFKYEGTAQMTIVDALVDVEVHIYRNVLTKCQVTTSVSKPSGAFLLTVGEQGTWLRFITSTVEYFLSKTIVPEWIMAWAFYPDVAAHLKDILEHAAKTTACT